MAKLFSFEETDVVATQPENLEVSTLKSDAVDADIESLMEKIDDGFESIDKLARMSAIIERSDGNVYSTEALALLMENIHATVGISYSKTVVSVEGLSGDRRISQEGVADTIGIIVKRIIDFIAMLYDKVEIVWNHTVRGLSEIKTKVSNLRNTAYSVRGSPRKQGIPTKKIGEALQTKNGATLTGGDVLTILKNHQEVAASTKDFRTALSDLIEYDIDRVANVFNRAKTGEKISKDDVFGPSVQKMHRLIKLASTSTGMLLGEGHAISLEIDESALDSYVFNRATLQMTMTKNFGAAKADTMVTASKNEAVEIAKTLEQLSNQMSSMCDLYMHFTHDYSKRVKNALISHLTGILGALLGVSGGGLPFTLVSLVTWVKAVYYQVITIIKFFGTKFSNVTFRTMEAAIGFVEASV